MPPSPRHEFAVRLLLAGLLVALACAWLARAADASTLSPQASRDQIATTATARSIDADGFALRTTKSLIARTNRKAR